LETVKKGLYFLPSLEHNGTNHCYQIGTNQSFSFERL
jgi:hypothetical protein